MEIHVLSEDTINKIAAGEVVERPVNVAKELIENSIDAGATAITCEIRDGGVTLLRVTDNGSGIDPSQITRAFQRHATSKISHEEDLGHLMTLGFRGEALSSIASVAEVEMITKTRDNLMGIRAVNTGLRPNNSDVIPLEISEIGAPDGTTVIVRNLFYNVPVRRKFLHSAATEAGYISDLMEHMALSHPRISFHYRVNGKERLHTTGNGNIREILYRIYGKETASCVLPLDAADETGELGLSGFIGRPEISRGTRSFELFFVNGRILQSPVLSKGLESGYRTDLMQHQFPFAVLYLTMPAEMADVNVHPSKKEVRFQDSQRIYNFIDLSVHRTLHRAELIPVATLRDEKEIRREEKEEKEKLLGEHREPFENTGKTEPSAPSVASSVLEGDQQELIFREDQKLYAIAPENKRRTGPDIRPLHHTRELSEERDLPESQNFSGHQEFTGQQEMSGHSEISEHPIASEHPVMSEHPMASEHPEVSEQLEVSEQPKVFEQTDAVSGADAGTEERPKIFTAERAAQFRIVGQIFNTYWIIETGDQMLIIDQHAAHEKVRFEHLMKAYRERREQPVPSQMLMPPTVVSFSGKEEACYRENAEIFSSMGFTMENLGGGVYAIRSIPLELYGTEPVTLLRDVIDELLAGKMSGDPQDIISRIATQSCKGAVKGNMPLSVMEARALIGEMLTMDNPYHCPHGRPTCILLSENEIEKKFKRIV